VEGCVFVFGDGGEHDLQGEGEAGWIVREGGKGGCGAREGGWLRVHGAFVVCEDGSNTGERAETGCEEEEVD